MHQEPNLEYEEKPTESRVFDSVVDQSTTAESGSDPEGKSGINSNHSEQWQDFVKYVERSADKSLVSLMRNSVLLQITQNSLTIGLQNTGLFTEGKREKIEECAQAFFNQEFTIFYKDSVDGLDDSVHEKSEQERIKAEQETKKQAAKSSNVQQVLAMFQHSKIKNIEILEEKEDVQGS